MYEIPANYINYLGIATSPQSTQTANAAISTVATGKNKFESFINNTTVIKSVQLLELLCLVATLFRNHNFFSKYFKS